MLGLAYASHVLAVCDRAADTSSLLLDRVASCIIAGVKRFIECVSPQGEISIEPSSRTATELTRSGSPKRFDYKCALRALVFAKEVLQLDDAGEVAVLLFSQLTKNKTKHI